MKSRISSYDKYQKYPSAFQYLWAEERTKALIYFIGMPLIYAVVGYLVAHIYVTMFPDLKLDPIETSCEFAATLLIGGWVAAYIWARFEFPSHLFKFPEF